MIDSIYIAMSGMLGHQRGLSVLSNNVANMNTPGFRGATADFSNVFRGSSTGGARSDESLMLIGQRGGGLSTSSARLNMQAGESESTGRDLDLMLKGEGFFILRDESGALRYTRNGQFEFVNNELVMSRDSKLKVMAYDASGNLATISIAQLQSNAPKATTEISIKGNLGASTGDGANANAVAIDAITVIDQGGASHTVRMVFTKDTDSSNTDATLTHWRISISENNAEIGTGKLDVRNGLGPAPGESPLPITLNFASGAPLGVSFDFTELQAFSTSNSVSVSKQNGVPYGKISSTTFDEKGQLQVTYSNSQTVMGAKLALARIPDDDGLEEIGNAQFIYRGLSKIVIGMADDGLKVASQSLERSNVDLTEEFSHLILIQRGYQASSQVLSTANDMLQELMNLRGQR